MTKPKTSEGILFSKYTGEISEQLSDFDGNKNIAHYAFHFEEATKAFFQHLNVTQEYQERTVCAMRPLEQNIVFKKKLHAGEKFSVFSQLLGIKNEKLLWFMHFMVDEHAELVATSELLYGNVNLKVGQYEPFSNKFQKSLKVVLDEHRLARWPDQAGRVLATEN